ncbi:MAG: glycosyltransferase family 2 protein [Gammaproteobacteria bacterium]|nr:MAG: glycosyltransferase family 2 protein [Gammaproteobacteria bacterium]
MSQSFENFELIISDNASTDNTEHICREYADRDSRIRYIRQPQNLGAGANLLFVLDEAHGAFFMWAAHDDVRSDDFLESNLEFLLENKDFVASTSPVRFIDGLPDSVKMGDKSLDQLTAEERFMATLLTWHACGRFYSLMRRSAIVESKIIRKKDYIGSDIAFIMELALKGKFNRLEQGYVALGRDGISGSGNIYGAYRTRLLSWVLPLHEFSAEIWKLSNSFPFNIRIRIAGEIFKMNLISFLHQIKIESKRKFS